jgi:hypothetical protein
MKAKNLLPVGVAVSALILSAPALRAGIVGSPHDFSHEAWNISPSDPNSVCGPCHQPHHADSTKAPLWGHTTTSQAFTMYNTANVPVSKMKAVPDSTPTHQSIACLSCHDGVTAVNSYGDPPNPKGGSAVTITNSAAIGTDLTHSHPISFVYDNNLAGNGVSGSATQDKWLKDPSLNYLVPVSGTFVPGSDPSINGFLLNNNHRVECSSCHDVHNQEGTPFDINSNPKLVKINGIDSASRGSLLCRSCHIK